MEIVYYLSASCLLAFMVLATYDGFYLHIWKYELFSRKESSFEHKTHTARAILFPVILWLLFINNDTTSFWFAIAFIAIDFIVLGMDAYAEDDSRKSIGGLPKWEYILHLFANSFHFASIFLIIATKVSVTDIGIIFNDVSNAGFAQEFVKIISINMIPGAIVLGFIHFILLFPKGIAIWSGIIQWVKNRSLRF